MANGDLVERLKAEAATLSRLRQWDEYSSSEDAIFESAAKGLTEAAQRIEELEGERNEAIDWTAIVERHGTDGFDDLAERWLAMEGIQRMHNAVTSVFSEWANDELMERFKAHMSAYVQQAFVEGCLVGVRTEMARSAPTIYPGDG